MLNKREREYLKFTLNEEKKTLRELEKLYEEALKSINEKITTLLARKDIENIDSVIYRLDYQKALKAQINAILDNLNANQYESIEKYLLDSYKNGFIGTMYDFHGQGIPLMIPIDQEQVLNALTIDSKLSEGLYKRLGEDITILKKKIRHEISRGIASAMSYTDITRNISNISKIGINNAYRIARTEGHRIQNQSSFDAMNKAKDKGAEVVKQWDATLDGRTRKTHRELDGKIVEVDEPFIFNDHKAMYPGGFGVASLDINCRCAILTRAKWELDEEELNTLKDRASYFGLDKTKDFKDFKEKYLSGIDVEQETITKHRNYAVQTKMLNGREFISKFDKMSDDKEERQMFLSESKKILQHRSGTNGEDLVLYNTTTKKWYRSTIGTEAFEVKYNEDVINAIKNSNKGDLISFHNHPGNSLPSISDLNSAYLKGYKKGYVLCHNGIIYEYTPPSSYISSNFVNNYVAKAKTLVYNKNEIESKTLELLAKEFGFVIKEVK